MIDLPAQLMKLKKSRVALPGCHQLTSNLKVCMYISIVENCREICTVSRNFNEIIVQNLQTVFAHSEQEYITKLHYGYI